MNEPMEEPATSRLDVWLWAVRIFKTRPLATAACRAGNVSIGGHEVKPARTIRAGETVQVEQGVVTRTLRVVGVPPSRVGAKLLAEFCEELTPPEEWTKARELRVQQILGREAGAGRPTKRERRVIDRLFG